MPLLVARFSRALDRAPMGTIAYFWPDTPTWLVEKASRLGLITVREMINSPLALAKPVLDDAYARAGQISSHGISDQDVARENAELKLYDRIFASNPEVEAALIATGIAPERILSSTFGWVKARFAEGPGTSGVHDESAESRGFRACFVGTMNVRKGVPELLAAWREARVNGELWLAGHVDPAIQHLVDEGLKTPGVRHFGHIDDIAAFYRQCDAFVFPTLEEGGPQVTYEAASCGLPIITTAMGAARLVEDDQTGRLVPAGSVSDLAQALQDFAADRARCKVLGREAQARAAEFEYGKVGRSRAMQLLALDLTAKPS